MNLMGRILILALEHKIDMLKILFYPLTAVPLSLCHIDGSMNKTDKSTLLKLLENRIQSIGPDCTIIDGFFRTPREGPLHTNDFILIGQK